MDFELSGEQQFLREAARGALSGHATVEAARDALDGGERLDLWDVGREAGWPGLVVSEARGGAGLGALDAMLVMAEAGRRRARRGVLVGGPPPPGPPAAAGAARDPPAPPARAPPPGAPPRGPPPRP